MLLEWGWEEVKEEGKTFENFYLLKRNKDNWE